eukprot:scaffold21794_cov76-Phaeocystis_antarctica.AAC.4
MGALSASAPWPAAETRVSCAAARTAQRSSLNAQPARPPLRPGLTSRTPRTVALRPLQHRSLRCRSLRRPQGLQGQHLPSTRSVRFARCNLTGCR